MWGNLTGAMGKALEKVQMIQSELESQMDAAVGANSEIKTEVNIESRTESGSKTDLKTFATNETRNNDEVLDMGLSNPNPLSQQALPSLQANNPGDATPSKQKKGSRVSKKGKSSEGNGNVNGNNSSPVLMDTVGQVSSTADNSPYAARTLELEAKLEAVQLKYDADISKLKEAQQSVISNLTTQHDSEMDSLKKQHLMATGNLQERITALEEQAKKFNKKSFDKAYKDWQVEWDEKITELKRCAAEEKNVVLAEMRSNEEAWKEKLSCVQQDYDSRLSSLQAQLAAVSSEGGDKEAVVAAEYKKEIDALHKKLAQRDEEIANKSAAAKKTKSSLQDQVAELTRQLEVLQESSVKKDAQLAELATEVESVQNTMEQQVNKKDAELASVISEHENLQNQMKQMMIKNDAAITSIIGERDILQNNLEEQVANSRAQLASAAAEREELQKDMNAQFSKKDAELARVLAELGSLQSSTHAQGVSGSEETAAQLAETAAALAASQKEVEAVRSQLVEKDAHIAAIMDDVGKLKEALKERERALETAAKNLSEQHKLVEGYTQKLSDLTSEIAEKDARFRQAQGSAVEDEENRKLVVRLQEQLKEQGERLSAFEKEGQSLAKKQSEMEKVVRNSKKELRDKDAEIQKLKDSKEQLVKAIEQTQDVLKKHEGDATNASKTLSAMQAVSQASTEKLVRLEAELTAKTEELASQRRSLETSWAEAIELKRTISELKADRDDLRKRIGEGTSKVMETESSRRDIEQREAVLRATSKQLQDSLQRQMAESSAREERLREEVNEMRKRWQEAVASRESMASELGSATAPMLRQISSLQESMRVKSEHWQNVESSLSERALRAENAAEIAEHKRALMEEQLLELKQQYASCNGKLSECQTQLDAAEALVERMRKRELIWGEEKAELDSRYAMEVAQRQSLQATLREIELRHKLEVQELQDATSVLKSQSELETTMLSKDMDLLREELASLRASGHGSATPLKRHQSASKLSQHSLNKSLGALGSQDKLYDGSVATSDASGDQGGYMMNGADLLVNSSLPSGEATFAATEKIQQRYRQRDDDMQALHLQIQRIEASRNALLDEVNYLSAHNSELEEQCACVPALREEVERCSKRTEMLLVLLGEKEEELEAVLGDMREVKHMYRAHLEELLEKSNPPLLVPESVDSQLQQQQ